MIDSSRSRLIKKHQGCGVDVEFLVRESPNIAESARLIMGRDRTEYHSRLNGAMPHPAVDDNGDSSMNVNNKVISIMAQYHGGSGSSVVSLLSDMTVV